MHEKLVPFGSDTKFDEATQEKLFSQYLLGKKRPQIQDYITGKSDDAQAAQIAGAKEWRSIADPRTGKTYADKGASGNKASISSDDWLSSMDAAKKQYQENLKLGLNETEAYSKAVSGLQAVTAKAPAINEAETPVATDAQANAFRKQEGKPYPDQIAAINTNNMPLYYSLAAGPGNSAPVNVASAASPKVPTFAPPPQIPEAPPIIQPLASDSSRNLTVSMPAPDVGQDIRDRGIAHIVTGGLSGRG